MSLFKCPAVPEELSVITLTRTTYLTPQQCMKGYDGRPVSHRHYKISRNASDKFIISACHPHPIFIFSFTGFFFSSLSSTHSWGKIRCELLTLELWSQTNWTLLEMYLDKLLQTLAELSPSNSWLTPTILVTKRANPDFPSHLFVRIRLLIFIIFLTCYCLEFFALPCLPWV